MLARGWYYCDFLLVTGDAYIDHPSFGTAIISRVLEDAGFRVAILSQPDFTSAHDFEAMGKPRYAVLINAAFGIHTIRADKSIDTCLEEARASLLSGRALKTFERFIELNQ